MVKHRVFFSFHFDSDVSRAGQIRNMGIVQNDSQFSDNEWEKVKKDSDLAIKRWINHEMGKQSVVVVLIGTETSERKWVQYEIQHAMDTNKGIVGVYVDKLKDIHGDTEPRGHNPLLDFTVSDSRTLADHVTTFDPSGKDSKEVYRSIGIYLPTYIDRAYNESHNY